MKKKTKLVFGIAVLGVLALVSVAVASGFWYFSNFIDRKANIPKALKTGNIVQKTEKLNTFGPSGLSGALVVYELPEEVCAKIKNEGLEFLNALEMTKIQKMRSKPAGPRKPWDETFIEWQPTPVQKDVDQWLRRRMAWAEQWTPNLLNFYQRYPDKPGRDPGFASTISPEMTEQVEHAILAPDCFYSYGGYVGRSVLIVDPDKRRAYYLYRG
jgi:hypothetical protein